jgi:ABC-2 type transport system ATP-binding protein
MSSHILSEVSELCDEVAMIDHGKLIVYDTIANVTSRFSQGGGLIEVGLLHSIGDIALSTIGRLPDVISAEKRDEKTITLRYNGSLEVQERLLSDLVKLNIGLISFKPAASELEDAYLKLIKSTL